MSAERAKKIESVPFMFDRHHHWDMMRNKKFNELLCYKEKRGNCNLPQSQGSLGGWVNTQRKFCQ